jgi:hypothetical protein
MYRTEQWQNQKYVQRKINKKMEAEVHRKRLKFANTAMKNYEEQKL